jgi:anaerobic selenocysteine-containing dehydrogenase
VQVEGDRVLRITGDKDDEFSRGYICPKAAALIDLYTDPDRLRMPVRRTADGFKEIGWEEAMELAARGIDGVRSRHGRDAVATYLGNPGAHTWSLLSMLSLRFILASRNNYSATSADQLPQHFTSAEMFGNLGLFPIPDIDRTKHMLILGANPAVSNGSIMSAPGARDRLREIKTRGGKVVVVDPRRTETAKLASEHIRIKPGGDPYLLLGMLHVLFAEGLTGLGSVAEHCDGLEEIRALAAKWSPERGSGPAGIEAVTIERLAREFAAAESAVAYGRVGVCQQQTGSVTHWLINVMNAVTGNLDATGGAMFTNPPIALGTLFRAAKLIGVGGAHGTFKQRVSGLPEMNGELPVAGLADEIETPGEGQIRAMVIYAGNPVLSTPGGHRLEQAMEKLEFCVAVDQYITETTRHADVILPPVSALERDDLDVVMPTVSVRNHIRFSPAAVPKREGGREDWEILGDLTSRLGDGVRGRALARLIGVGNRLRISSPERLIDAAFAVGPYGILRKGLRQGLTVAKVKRAEHGIDLGALEPRLPGALQTPGKRVRLAPQLLLEEAAHLEQLAQEREHSLSNGYDLTLIGRRQLRSNNSWLHNSRRLMKGADRCTAILHPDDASARGLADGGAVRVVSSTGAIELPLEVSDEMRPGVVSIPHGFGHNRTGVSWSHAATKPGVSMNDITDPAIVDRITGNAAFNSVPVRIEAA